MRHEFKGKWYEIFSDVYQVFKNRGKDEHQTKTLLAARLKNWI